MSCSRFASCLSRQIYDWTQAAQRIDHGPNSMECIKFYNTSDPCSLIFVEKGMYAVFPRTGDCCFDLPGIPSVPPTWVVDNDYVQVGIDNIRESAVTTRTQYHDGDAFLLALLGAVGVACRHWQNPAFEHEYWDTITTTRGASLSACLARTLRADCDLRLCGCCRGLPRSLQVQLPDGGRPDGLLCELI